MLIRHIKILIECKTQQIGPTSTFITQELLSIHTEIKKYKYFNVYNYCCSQAVVSSDSEWNDKKISKYMGHKGF